MAANKLAQSSTFYGIFRFGPAPDGVYILDLPLKRLLSGNVNSKVKVLTAHNSNEGNHYTDPSANATSFDTYMHLYFPSMNSTTLEYLSSVLYPEVYNGSYPYTTPFGRLDLAVSDFTFSCSPSLLSSAFLKSNLTTHQYLFSIPPGNHTEDVPYTFYNGPVTSVQNETVADILQKYINNFAANGNPNGNGLPVFEDYGGKKVLDINKTSIAMIEDQGVERCKWWQQGLFGDDFN
jgi:carboxylesterase type B